MGAIKDYIKNKDSFVNSGEIEKMVFKNVVQIPMKLLNEIES